MTTSSLRNVAACAWALAAGLALATAAARAETLEVIDPAAHYPEGPAWHQGALYYVEYSRGNVRRWDGTGTRTLWHRDGCGPSAVIRVRGHWLVACYDENALAEIDDDGRTLRTFRTDVDGHPFVGPNDFAADDRGGIFFSASGAYDIKAPITGMIYRLDADGHSIRRVADTIHYPNGLCLSADGRSLLVAEMLAGRILAFTVDARGHLTSRRVWARLQDLAPPTDHADAYNGPDGIKLGPNGHVYIAQNGSGRVLEADADARLVRSIPVPAPFVSNVAPGADGDVYITAAFDQWQEPFAGAVYRWRP